MKKILLSLCSLLFITACQTIPSTETTETSEPRQTSETTTTSEPAPTKSLTEHNVLFTLNTQEFIFSEKSIETVNRIIDIHETYNVPVDIYLDSVILQSYLEEAPELITRLKESSLVSISYHARPPMPYYNEYDWMGLEAYSTVELWDLIVEYGTHGLDPATGDSLESEGGFAYFEEVFGIPPLVASTPTNSKTGPLVQKFFEEYGAKFIVDNGRDHAWGSKRGTLWIRPEDKEVKLFEETEKTADQIFEEFFKQNAKSPAFMNIKVHDNDFITDESAWVSIYVKNKKQNRNTLTPPFDLTEADDRSVLTESESEPLWTLYEACVKYAGEHADEITSWNMKELAEQR